MSFILDALKKSESDRQRQSGPSLFEVKVAPPRRRLPIWAVAITLLLGINVVVISWMLLRHPTAQQPPAANIAVAPPQRTAPVATASSAGETRGVERRTTASVAPASGGAIPAAAPGGRAAGSNFVSGSSPSHGSPSLASDAGQSGSPAPPAGNPSDYAPAVEPAAGVGARASTATDELPLYQQIVTSSGLPALHLDLHVFARRPGDRFVMINMHRLGEGDSLPDGVQVEVIRPDGVVLSYRGTRFLLPRN